MKTTIDLANEVWAMSQGPQPIDIATVAIAARLDEFVERIAELEAVLATPHAAAIQSGQGLAVQCAIGSIKDAEKFKAALDAAPVPAPVQPIAGPACDVPPGWRCTRMRGHPGPCAAVESPEDKAFVERGMRRIRDAEDAQRYRLMKRGQHWSVIDGAGNTLRAEALDAAVDAAIAAQQGGAA